MAGYSDRVFQEEFRTAMKKRLTKNFKTTCIAFGVIYPIAVLLTLLLSKSQENRISLLVATMAILFVVFGITLAIFWLKTIRQRRKLNDPYIDGTVIKNTKNRTVSTRRHGRRTRYTIVIETRTGNHIKVKNEIARPYYNLLEVGDEVRYHPGFVYPIELSDKSKMNICAFCGKGNDADVCACCGKPMLI